MLDIHLLGAFSWFWKERPIAWGASRGARLLLATLALVPGHRMDRAHLAETLWPESFGDQARTNLRKVIHELKTAIPSPEEVFLFAGSAVGLREAPTWRVDALEFVRCAQSQRVDVLRQALKLYKGELLPRESSHHLEMERGRLRELYAQAVERVLEDLARRKAWAEAMPVAWAAVDVDPLREAHWQRLLTVLGHSGDVAAVRAAYRRLTVILRQEVQARPAAHTEEAYQRALQVAWGSGSSVIGAAATAASPGDVFLPRPALWSAFIAWMGSEAAVFHLWGAGGQGKSAWLRWCWQRCRQAGCGAVWIDGRAVTPAPAGIQAALAAVAVAGPTPYVFVDHCERWAAAAGFLLTQWLPRQVPGVRLVTAGRRPIGEEIPLDGRRRLGLVEVEVCGFTRAEARAYLELRGVEEASVVERVLEAAGGNPLALSVAADLVVAPVAANAALNQAWPGVVARMAQHLLDEVEPAPLRRLVQACADLYVVNAELADLVAREVGLVVPGEPPWYDQMAHFSGLRPGLAGLVWNEDVRAFLAADFARRYPECRQRVRLAAWRYLRRLLAAQAAEERERTTLEALYLCGDASRAWHRQLFPGSAGADVWVSAGQGEPVSYLNGAEAEAAWWHLPGVRRRVALTAASGLAGFSLAAPPSPAGTALLADGVVKAIAGYQRRARRRSGDPPATVWLWGPLVADPAVEGAEAALWRDRVAMLGGGGIHVQAAPAPAWLVELGFRPLPAGAGHGGYVLDVSGDRFGQWIQRQFQPSEPS